MHAVMTEEMPKDWEEGITCPVFKKVDIWNCDNYTGITFHNTSCNSF
jgi:hypothetical protein